MPSVQTSIKRVLIVDDEPGLLNLLRGFLTEDLAYTVAVARNAAEALVLLTEFYPTHVLTDHRMAGMTGVELINEIKLISPKTKILLMSGAAVADRLATKVDADVVIISKPFDLTDLELKLK